MIAWRLAKFAGDLIPIFFSIERASHGARSVRQSVTLVVGNWFDNL